MALKWKVLLKPFTPWHLSIVVWQILAPHGGGDHLIDQGDELVLCRGEPTY